MVNPLPPKERLKVFLCMLLKKLVPFYASTLSSILPLLFYYGKFVSLSIDLRQVEPNMVVCYRVADPPSPTKKAKKVLFLSGPAFIPPPS